MEENKLRKRQISRCKVEIRGKQWKKTTKLLFCVAFCDFVESLKQPSEGDYYILYHRHKRQE